MNFTREPIIETIISPREGHKLLVRSSKSGGPAEEYFVDALEVVSFGRAFFFRSLERPKAFLVPTSDYEVLEVKETRVALKTGTHERNIKIGGGRDASMKTQHREAPQESEEVAEEEAPAQEPALDAAVGSRMDKRRDRRRRRHRRGDERWGERGASEGQQQSQEEVKTEGGGAEDETKVSSSMFSSLIPPPPTLISETLHRYKDKEFAEGNKEVEEKKEKKEPPAEEDSGSESSPLHRVAQTQETTPMSFLKVDGNSFFY